MIIFGQIRFYILNRNALRFYIFFMIYFSLAIGAGSEEYIILELEMKNFQNLENGCISSRNNIYSLEPPPHWGAEI